MFMMMGSSSAGGAVAAGFVGRLDLDVAHVDLLVHQQHGRPSALLAPVFRTGGLVDVHHLHLSAVVLGPLLAPLVDDGHEVALAVVLVALVWPVVVVPAVQHHSDQSILPRWLRVLDSFEPELVVDVLHEEDVVQEVVLDLHLAQLVDVCVSIGLRLMVWQKLGNRSSM